jgi:hypothetical protein
LTKEEKAAYMRNWLNSSEENKEKNRKRAAEWAALNKEKNKINKRKRDLLARYAMTIEEWDALFIAQGARCAICGTHTPGKRQWHTDHCHATDKVRGILCMQCNAMLGFSKDNITVLSNAIKYLEKETTCYNLSL